MVDRSAEAVWEKEKGVGRKRGKAGKGSNKTRGIAQSVGMVFLTQRENFCRGRLEVTMSGRGVKKKGERESGRICGSEPTHSPLVFPSMGRKEQNDLFDRTRTTAVQEKAEKV